MSPLSKAVLGGWCPSCGRPARTSVVGQYLVVGCAPPPPVPNLWPEAKASPPGCRAWIHRDQQELQELQELQSLRTVRAYTRVAEDAEVPVFALAGLLLELPS